MRTILNTIKLSAAVVGLLFLMTPLNSIAQGNHEFDFSKYEQQTLNVLKTSPFTLLISQIPITGSIRLMYERVLGLKQSTVIGASYVFPNLLFRQLATEIYDTFGVNISAHGFRAQIGYRYYLTGKNAPNGLFVGPHISANIVKVNYKEIPDIWTNIYYLNANALFGFQWLIKGKVGFDIYTGFGYRQNFFIDFEEGEDPKRTDFPDNLRNFKFTLATNIAFGIMKKPPERMVPQNRY